MAGLDHHRFPDVRHGARVGKRLVSGAGVERDVPVRFGRCADGAPLGLVLMAVGAECFEDRLQIVAIGEAAAATIVALDYPENPDAAEPLHVVL